MSDLRDRIAAVLFDLNAGEDWNGDPVLWSEVTESYRNCWRRQADKVIAALGLEVERGGTYAVGGEATSHRYVTEWENDV